MITNVDSIRIKKIIEFMLSLLGLSKLEIQADEIYSAPHPESG